MTADKEIRRAIGSASALPATLTTRFVILFVLILAGTVSIYGYLGLRLGSTAEARAADCLAGSDLEQLSRLDLGGIRGMIGTTTVVSCVAGDKHVVLWSGVAGLLAVGGVAFAAYFLAPRARRARLPRAVTPHSRRANLLPLAGYDPQAAAEAYRIIAGFAPIRTPQLHTDPLARQSYVFGSPRRPQLVLAGNTVRNRVSNPDGFTADLLHELAHLKNRDLGPTLLAATAWWSFAVLAMVPYLGLLIADLLGGGPLGWRPPTMTADDLHATLAILAMILLVVLTRLAVLRDREIAADATAGGHPDGAAVARHLANLPLEAPSRTPVLLRRHPPRSLRRRAATDPWAVPSLSFLQLLAAGAGLSALSQDCGTFAWQAMIAAGFDPVPSPRTTLLLITAVAVATAGPTVALAWLIEARTWRTRLRGLVEPVRSPVIGLALALGAGMLLGEAGSVSAANASHWGVFDGVGDGNPATAAVSAAALVAIVLGLCRWSWDNAAAWLPTVDGSLRRVSRWSIAVGVVAFLPWYATWWSMHDEPLFGRAYLWNPGLASALAFPYVSLPAGTWLQITYVPLDLLALTPGVAVLTVLPVILTAVGLARRRVAGPPRWAGAIDFRPPDDRPPVRRAFRAGAIGGALVFLAGLILAMAGHAAFPSGALTGPDKIANTNYLLVAACVLTAAVGAGTAAMTALSHDSRSVVFGLIAALVVACVGAVVTPLLMFATHCGPGLTAACRIGGPVNAYAIFFSLAGTVQPVKTLVAGMIVTGVAVAVRRRPPVARATTERRPSAAWTGVGLALSGALLVVAALVSL